MPMILSPVPFQSLSSGYYLDINNKTRIATILFVMMKLISTLHSSEIYHFPFFHINTYFLLWDDWLCLDALPEYCSYASEIMTVRDRIYNIFILSTLHPQWIHHNVPSEGDI
jgi:hypothetical protein